ncbi:MAG: aldo/keto reductase [Acidobacteriota bacterium]
MNSKLSRRQFLQVSAAGVVWTAAPALCLGRVAVSQPMTRPLGRTGFEVTTLGLGGQASLQWTPESADPEAIIVKAVRAGVNYLDTSNVYGPSQVNFGKAFRTLGLVPGTPGYDDKARRSLFVASKTMVRYARGTPRQGILSRSEGGPNFTAVDDLRRSLSLMFGDGRGAYPPGAYLDLFQIHNLNTLEEVDAIYEGLDDPDPKAERIGALAALLDFRDGTNRTGLNPREEKLIRHIGITGHFSSPVLMECLQRDQRNILDTLLVAINANDRRYLCHQYNAIPVARAKNVGVIAMKVFADGAMYTKEPRWSRMPSDVVTSVGAPELPSRPLVEYALSTPGVCTAIIGIGRIDPDDRQCQLAQNLSAAQIRAEDYSETDRREIEQLALRARQGKTNWFQLQAEGPGVPREVSAVREQTWSGSVVRLSWQGAYAADEPILHYEVRRDGVPVGSVGHVPQVTKEPFWFDDQPTPQGAHAYQVVAVDAAGRRAASEVIQVAG